MSNQIGLFGKLPAHGDFVKRHVSSAFLSIWDEWLQCSVSGSKELLGDSWLDIYLTSSIWRFALRPGVINEHAWAGILIPSVDSVGRYFPLSLVQPFDAKTNVFALMSNNQSWFESLEAAALAALQNSLDADQLSQMVSDESASLWQHGMTPAAQCRNLGNAMVMTGGHNEAERYAALLNSQFGHQASCSIWSTGETANSPATTVVVEGLPKPDQFVFMLDGRWNQ